MHLSAFGTFPVFTGIIALSCILASPGQAATFYGYPTGNPSGDPYIDGAVGGTIGGTSGNWTFVSGDVLPSGNHFLRNSAIVTLTSTYSQTNRSVFVYQGSTLIYDGGNLSIATLTAGSNGPGTAIVNADKYSASKNTGIIYFNSGGSNNASTGVVFGNNLTLGPVIDISGETYYERYLWEGPVGAEGSYVVTRFRVNDGYGGGEETAFTFLSVDQTPVTGKINLVSVPEPAGLVAAASMTVAWLGRRRRK